ncbi:hypothetical protein PHLCEN_2v6828 [Hermanssonia centrifuga]|uniref:Uncharacterized protein n=1 Tax=Hermanssonia centrifuga TaxID=98765 RepID=A0A2R6NY94_9APHY|nr:hypothetical protein PHLCEN_2v6828 [Hermanssonia centrifuga]
MTNPELSVSYQEQAIHARDKPCTEPRFGIDHSRFPESRICIYRLVRQFKPNKDHGPLEAGRVWCIDLAMDFDRSSPWYFDPKPQVAPLAAILMTGGNSATHLELPAFPSGPPAERRRKRVQLGIKAVSYYKRKAFERSGGYLHSTNMIPGASISEDQVHILLIGFEGTSGDLGSFEN